MDFATAYDPFRALRASWGVLKRAPLTVLVGGILLFLMDGGCTSGHRYSVDDDDFRVEESEDRGVPAGGEEPGPSERAIERVLDFDWWVFVLVALIVSATLLVSLALWLFSCLIRVGFPRAVESVLATGDEAIAVVFRAEGRWLNMVFATLLQILATIAAVVPIAVAGLLVAVVAAVTGSEALGVLLGVGGAFLGLLLWVYVCLGLSLTSQAVALEDVGPFEALERSWTLVRGNRLRLLLFYVVMWIVTVIGLLACCVGVFVTAPLCYTANAEAYLRLVRSPEERTAWIA